MSTEPEHRDRILSRLLDDADLPGCVAVEDISQWGLDHEVRRARLSDGRDVVVRYRPRRAEPARMITALLEAHDIPAPQLLAASSEAMLHEFIPGSTLGEVLDDGQCSPETWAAIGRAYQKTHSVRFPASMVGVVEPNRIVMTYRDPVRAMHQRIDAAQVGLREVALDALDHLHALHEVVDASAAPLRAATTSLLHGDINMWNIIVSSEGAWLIDWDEARVGDPSLEVALLDKHVSLFNGIGLHEAFFEGYGVACREPATSLHRIVETLHWIASSDWTSFDRDDRPTEFGERSRAWRETLLSYVSQLPSHLERIRSLDSFRETGYGPR